MEQQVNVTVSHENGWYWARVEAFPGVFATGDTLDELRESLEEAIALWHAKPGDDPPAVTLGELELDEPLHADVSTQLALAM